MFNDKFSRISLLVFIGFILILITYNMSNYFLKDNLRLDYFDENTSIVVKNEYYDISGSADSIKNIFINKKEYFLDENNNFSIKVYLFEGVNIFHLEAIKKNGDIIYKKIIIIRDEKQ